MVASQDQSAEQRGARLRSIAILSLSSVIGLLCFILQLRNLSLSGILGLSPSFVSDVAQFEKFVLPRALLELQPIEEKMGYTYYSNAVMMMASMSIGGVVTCILNVVSRKKYDLCAEKGIRVCYINFVVVLFFLFYRPPDFKRGGLTLNIIDIHGFYLFKESLVIGVGYLFLAGLLGHMLAKLSR